jgi:predicted metal-dependent phosphoesterase TrpH
MLKKKYQNLHSHTRTSDGKLSYIETLKVCERNNISVVAFCDHDSLPSVSNIKTVRNYKSHVGWIIGTEISSGLPKELGGSVISNFHIVGLFVDPFNRNLKDFCKKMQLSRIERAKKIVKNLKKLGFDISIDDCLLQAQYWDEGKTINRPHITAAIIGKEKNIEILKKIKTKMRRDSQSIPEVRKKYEEIKKSDIKRWPYQMFLDNNSYIKGVYVEYLYSLEFDKVVELIRGAGGVSILAHWTFCKNRVDINLVEKLLEEKRLDGVEVVYNYYKSPERKKEIFFDMENLKKIAKKHNALQSGGADSHSEEDILRFVRDKDLAPKTIGMAEEIINNNNINLAFSSFLKRKLEA